MQKLAAAKQKKGYQVASATTESRTQTEQPLETILADIEMWLNTHRPDVMATFRPPASDADLGVLLKTLQQKRIAHTVARDGTPLTDYIVLIHTEDEIKTELSASSPVQQASFKKGDTFYLTATKSIADHFFNIGEVDVDIQVKNRCNVRSSCECEPEINDGCSWSYRHNMCVRTNSDLELDKPTLSCNREPAVQVF